MRTGLVFGLIVFALGCGPPEDNFPDVYDIWHEVARCVGTEENVDLPSIHVLDTNDVCPHDAGGKCLGVYHEDHRTIDVRYDTLSSIRHELLHFALHQRYSDGDPHHRRREWGRCAER